MRQLNDDDLRVLLGYYTVSGPRPAVVAETKRRMRAELALLAEPEKTSSAGLVLALVGVALLICLNLFYVATVGTLLKYFLHGSFMACIQYWMLGVSAAGVSLVSGMVVMIYFKTFQAQKAVAR